MRRRRRNPRAMGATMKEWTQNIGMLEAASAGAGLIAADMIPSMIITDTTTTANKILRLVLSGVTAIAAGAVGRSFVSTRAGQAAILGGLAGTVSQSLKVAGIMGVGRRFPPSMGRRSIGTVGTRRIGMPEMVSPAPTREGETVSIITP